MQINNAKRLFGLSPANNSGHLRGWESICKCVNLFPKRNPDSAGMAEAIPAAERLRQAATQTHPIWFFLTLVTW